MRLTAQYPRLAPHVSFGPSGNGYASIDWKDPRALLELTRALLHEALEAHWTGPADGGRQDFELDWEMPLDRLCPTVM